MGKTIVAAGHFRPYPNTQHAKVRAVGWLEVIQKFFAETECEQVPIVSVAEAPYPEGKSPTSGWAAIWHCIHRDIRPCVIGFDLRAAPNYATMRMHFPDFEIDGLKKLTEEGKIEVHHK